ncbi:EVI5-like, partial [Egretta garzetta]
RLLEADSKSMRSMNGSRRNSGSSLVSSSSASSNLSHLEEDTWILWGRIVNEWDEWRKKKEKLLKVFAPFFHRSSSAKGSPTTSVPSSGSCSAVPPTCLSKTNTRSCSRCPLPVRSSSDGISPAPTQSTSSSRDRTAWARSCCPLFLFISPISHTQEQLPELNIHFRSQSFLTSMYASSWFLTLFLTTFPLPVATRVFDIFMYEGLEIVFRVGMALLQFNQAELVQLDMEGMSQYFQKVIPHQFDSCPDKLILRAFQVKYNPKKMKRLEKEYATIKNKEMEEQIEIK